MKKLSRKKKESSAIDFIEINGNKISVDEIVFIANNKGVARLSTNEDIIDRINKSHHFIQQASSKRKPIYGVNTGFGGMATHIY